MITNQQFIDYSPRTQYLFMEAETYLSDCQILRDLLFPISNQKDIFFRNYKNVNFCFTSADPNEICLSLTSLFSKIVEEHAPLK